MILILPPIPFHSPSTLNVSSYDHHFTVPIKVYTRGLANESHAVCSDLHKNVKRPIFRGLKNEQKGDWARFLAIIVCFHF